MYRVPPSMYLQIICENVDVVNTIQLVLVRCEGHHRSSVLLLKRVVLSYAGDGGCREGQRATLAFSGRRGGWGGSNGSSFGDTQALLPRVGRRPAPGVYGVTNV